MSIEEVVTTVSIAESMIQILYFQRGMRSWIAQLLTNSVIYTWMAFQV